MAPLYRHRPVWVLCLLLGCTGLAPAKRAGNSAGFNECAEQCSYRGLDVKGVAETEEHLWCYCGRPLIPEAYRWPAIGPAAPSYRPGKDKRKRSC